MHRTNFEILKQSALSFDYLIFVMKKFAIVYCEIEQNSNTRLVIETMLVSVQNLILIIQRILLGYV